MSEYVKDLSRPNGWKVISSGAKGKKPGAKSDGAPVTAEAMDGEAEGSEGEEGPDSCEE